jgi:hypothetical protein
LDTLDVDTLRDHGWIFEGPPSGEPWWYFYTLYSKCILSGFSLHLTNYVQNFTLFDGMRLSNACLLCLL